MKYIFEDNPLDELSKLFCMLYPDNVLSNIKFVRSNGRIVNEVINFIELGEDYIFVFMDMIPSNKEIKRIYVDLYKLNKLHGNVLVFPIVCSEYYFIKFLSRYSFLVKDNSNVNLCVSKGFYKNSNLLFGDSKKYCKNFEKFCKLLLIHADVFNDCIHSKKADNSFYRVDCRCDNAVDDCIKLSLSNKAFEYLSEYPCLPSGFNLNENVFSTDEIIKIHRQLVDEFNSWSDSFKLLDNGNEDSYFNINYMI